jgi:two-component system chemotaxis sensor kinase CheA
MALTEKDRSRFEATFFEEAAEHVAAMEQALLALETNPDNSEHVNSLFRAAHSIKGGAGMFGFQTLAGVTHVLESRLDRFRQGHDRLTPRMADVLLHVADALRGLLEAARLRGPEPPGVNAIREALERELAADAVGGRAQAGEARGGPQSAPLVDGETSEPPDRSGRPGESRDVQVTFEPGRDLFARGMDPLLVVRDLLSLGDNGRVRTDLTALPDLGDLDPERCYLRFVVELRTSADDAAIRDVFAFVEDVSKIDIVRRGSAPSGESPGREAMRTEVSKAAASARTVRVSTEKIDKIIDLVGELVIAETMILAALSSEQPDARARLRDAAEAIGRNTRELQEEVMGVRMVPVGTVFGRFPRVARDLAAKFGKAVVLHVDGEDTEIDRGMVEQLADPLTHLVRNAIDHGIEPPDVRAGRGKPAEGRIALRAANLGGRVVVDDDDDGAGLNLERIREKAVALGLLDADAEPDEQTLKDFIFAPGFSTAHEITDVSGRGVGMDVVKRTIESVGGVISVSSEPGKGTRIRLSLPLTTAIMDGLSVRVADQTFVLPLLSIVESFRLKPEHLKRVFGAGEVVRVRGDAIPLVRLHRELGIAVDTTDPSRSIVCVVDTSSGRIGLLVDELLGQGQVVIKTLETNYRRIDGMVGATIAGDGRVALIVDPQGIARRATSGRGKENEHAARKSH